MKIAAFKLTVLRMANTVRLEILDRRCDIYLGTVLAAIFIAMEHYTTEKSQLAG